MADVGCDWCETSLDEGEAQETAAGDLLCGDCYEEWIDDSYESEEGDDEA